MGEVVNLRRARKAKQREAAAVTAAENRARSGATKAAREAADARKAATDRVLDGARTDTETPRN